MAEPLTSSDMWRIERGWGTSGLASPEERKRFYEAGELPISGLDARRLAEGRGISPMASRAEKEAWVASEVMLGKRGSEDLPEFYGGMGERPSAAKTGFYSTGEETAYGRRRRRMQEDFDARMKLQTEQENLARQTEIENRRLLNSEENLLLQQRQEARLQAAETKAKEEAFKISDDADRAMAELLGGVDLYGNQIKGLDPDDPNYMKDRNDLIRRYSKAIKDEAFKSAIANTDKSYFDKINFDQQLQAQEESAGRIVERQVAAETRAAEKQAGIRKEEREQAKEDVLVSQEREIDKQIRAQRQILAGLQGQKPTRTLEKSATQASNKLLDLRIERAALRGLAFEDQESYKQAVDAGKKPPAGTTIYIGRKQVKVK